MERIYTDADLMFTLAAALENGDLEMLEDADRQTCDWLGADHERNARNCLIESIRGAIYEMQS